MYIYVAEWEKVKALFNLEFGTFLYFSPLSLAYFLLLVVFSPFSPSIPQFLTKLRHPPHPSTIHDQTTSSFFPMRAHTTHTSEPPSLPPHSLPTARTVLTRTRTRPKTKPKPKPTPSPARRRIFCHRRSNCCSTRYLDSSGACSWEPLSP
ncbi:hypothetical protein B0H65DRAFT_231497 [Neurospora tetraspora]|uniref:Uncharacterized protein n=1 Tax=Neurospora tetraspora TaxID=94610 RepID=A0AAE0JE58_9PEZI|nr:hypothetical protein B0H65DRAFT_231497 [Neurospora tetraspora]